MAAIPSQAHEFAALARDFATLIGAPGPLSPEGVLGRAHRLLASLYLVAWSLPSLPPAPDSPSWTSLPFDTVKAAEERLAGSLGGWVNHRYLVNPFDATEAPKAGSLPVDLVDIYAELATGLQYWDHGRGDWAMNYWRSGFESGWGKSVAGTLNTLHALAFFKGPYHDAFRARDA